MTLMKHVGTVYTTQKNNVGNVENMHHVGAKAEFGDMFKFKNSAVSLI